ncbi:hypothetical protein CPIN18021_0347 [Campylobacter pinnipediorum subsp. caledonicus]|uniref:Uncharacterized protein n=1 Tax=Campylobacter pinnipediorum subsp. caledonicus TaxID=1874362 RepID=A0A1S6U654_9BACT|nr:hypothetical protein [Campylobacter pinnipediorum]AQW85587.1 hypothetical protein CPIN18020_0346 [Campylobacter pinnipediorum subsp. caledonicus]AQW87193.1 hypothetical protein CPIN18021_0347 [Campylobacter pinnipediorum subsp. caledonicus]OPA71867.1 hypothetical protein BB381_06950 [Campylobacter pinnipediorum subsp. caledonicus]
MIISSEDTNLNPITLLVKYKQTTHKELSDKLGYTIDEIKEFEKLDKALIPLRFEKALNLYTELLKTKISIKDIYSKINI